MAVEIMQVADHAKEILDVGIVVNLITVVVRDLTADYVCPGKAARPG